MASAHKRRKQPELVRRALIEHAARLAVEHGLAAVTMQAVSAAAGVSKGGFTHHFPSKQALVDAVFHELLTQIDREIDERIKADPEPFGSFTRAYLGSVCDIGLNANGGPWAALSVSMLTDPDLRSLWIVWYQKRLAQHQHTDADKKLAAVRLAADGIWLADLAGMPLNQRAQLQAYLLSLTHVRS